ncbi:hypothetical protein EPN52_15020 [bacterium]|nr:MAG: hypothetical protein EPN52_15020 [bacterium]
MPVQPIAVSLTPERRFILAGARLQADRTQLAQLAGTVGDWEALVAEATALRYDGLLARACDGLEAVPRKAREALAQRLRLGRARNVLYLDAAAEALRTLHAGGLAPVALKGVALAEALYVDTGLRQFGDLDVLLPRGDIESAERLLREIGYAVSASPHDRSWYDLNYYHLPPLQRSGGGMTIELHWGFARRPHPFRLDYDGMRERAVLAVVGGERTLVLSPEDRAIHLAVHLAWGNGFTAHAIGLVDIAETVRAGLNWELLGGLTRQQHAGQVLLPSLEMARDLLDAPVPHAMLATLEPWRGGPLARRLVPRAQARFFAQGEGFRTWLRLAWLERNDERAQLLWENLRPSAHPENDGRGSLLARLSGGARRALRPFLTR